MRYEIQEKRSELTGTSLVIRFPEEELDRKALYTIQRESPSFLVPFRYRNVDGQVECTYQTNSFWKLRYRFGPKSPAEYALFWDQVLQPLLDCGDWFLKPFSFVLDTQYLYADRGNTLVSYLYIPTKMNCVDSGALREMAVELSKQNPVTDPNLENQVLRALMDEFQPAAFLDTIQKYSARFEPSKAKGAEPYTIKEPPVSPPDGPLYPPMPEAPPEPKPQSHPPVGTDDIFIDLGEKDKGQKEKRKGLFGAHKEKEKPKKEDKKKKKHSGKEKDDQEFRWGAGAEQGSVVQTPPQEKPGSKERPVVYGPGNNGETEVEDEGEGPGLRYTGRGVLPSRISVSLSPGGSFTIGRFDITVGHPQSDFEFAQDTKGVSRHHAVIEREMGGGYSIIDLGSKGGTFVSGERLTPNVPHRLNRGWRVSFGPDGADYIWEE